MVTNTLITNQASHYQLIINDQQLLTLVISGNWLLTANFPTLEPVIAQLAEFSRLTQLNFSTENLERWDSLLITELIKLLTFAHQQGIHANKTTLPIEIQRLLALVNATPQRPDAQRLIKAKTWHAHLWYSYLAAINHFTQIVMFIGEVAQSVIATLTGQSHFRRIDLWLYIQECGPSALGIVSLISLLVGLILAFVGALELSLFGAQIYIANLVSLGMTREMGALMTAIIMSGRTGAAYAAQLGTMQVNNEIDALRTMNFEPIAFLVLPRMLSLILIMPLLCLYADLMGIVGGGLVTISFFDVSVTEYLNRTANAVHFTDFMVGFVKSAVFGILIAISGCMRGMQSGRSASAVGDAATSAVVTSMVFIVISDSIMTIICNRIGI